MKKLVITEEQILSILVLTEKLVVKACGDKEAELFREIKRAIVERRIEVPGWRRDENPNQ